MVQSQRTTATVRPFLGIPRWQISFWCGGVEWNTIALTDGQTAAAAAAATFLGLHALTSAGIGDDLIDTGAEM